MKNCVAFGEAWIAVAEQSLTLFSTLRNVDMKAGDTKINEQVKSILVAIKNAINTCGSLRLADIQVIFQGATLEQLLTLT